jgi:hypothetical protein
MLASSQLSIVGCQWQKTRDKYSFSWLDLFERMNQIQMYSFWLKHGQTKTWGKRKLLIVKLLALGSSME